jgi:hypothetical protein
MTCGHCGASNPDGARFCQSCGKSLAPEPRACAACGTINSETAAFCSNCGSALAQKKASARGAEADLSLRTDAETRSGHSSPPPLPRPAAKPGVAALAPSTPPPVLPEPRSPELASEEQEKKAIFMSRQMAAWERWKKHTNVVSSVAGIAAALLLLAAMSGWSEGVPVALLLSAVVFALTYLAVGYLVMPVLVRTFGKLPCPFCGKLIPITEFKMRVPFQMLRACPHCRRALWI